MTSRVRYFSPDQDPRLYFCSETGEQGIDDGFLEDLDNLRHDCGFPFVITSGYRSAEHSKEVVKHSPGWHTRGRAADIQVRDGATRYRIVEAAIEYGFSGIGIAKTFVHVDTRDTTPVIWTYS